MPCCGQKRTALKTSTSPNASAYAGSQRGSGPNPVPSYAPVRTAPVAAAAPAMNLPGSYTIALQYTENSAIVVEGAVSHRRYEFSAQQPLQMVDARDAATLLQTRFFVRR
jgi:hypothetical protein